jgi:Protein of unknown function (DUF2829)
MIASAQRTLPWTQAARHLEAGAPIARASWPKGCCIVWIEPTEFSPCTRAFIAIETPAATDATLIPWPERVPWEPSNEDLRAEDWRVVE